MTPLDLTHNRIVGWHPYYDENWYKCDSVPFRSGGRSVGTYDGEFYFYFSGIDSRVILELYLSEALWGKDIKIPDPDWSKKYGDASLSVVLKEESVQDNQGSYGRHEVIWEVTNESTPEDMYYHFGSTLFEFTMNFTYDTETRACKLSMCEDDYDSGAISIDAILEAWH